MPIWGWIAAGGAALVTLGTLVTLAARAYLAQVKRGDAALEGRAALQKENVELRIQLRDSEARAIAQAARADRLEAAEKAAEAQVVEAAAAAKERDEHAIDADPAAVGELLSRPFP